MRKSRYVSATCVLIKHGEVLVANLGDSRAVASLVGAPKQLTQDHNTGNPRERERVTAMGGVIKDNRVGGVLIPTRSFGDFLLKSEPDKPPWKQVERTLEMTPCGSIILKYHFILFRSSPLSPR